MVTSTKIEARELRKKYKGKEVVKGVSLSVSGGEIVGLLGPNGAGKTTTFSMIAGFVTPTGGTLLLNDQSIVHLPPYKRARKGLVYLSQEASVFRSLTVEENIRAIAQTLPGDRKSEDAIVQQRMEQLGIDRLARQKANTLSGGERRRLEIARALVLSPDFLLLDEPFSGVDPKSVSEVSEIINSLKSSGMGILLTDHNVRETLRAVDRAYLLFEGNVLAHGSAEFLISDPATRSKYLGDDFKA
jgi:lipopolysaccharide export system ATP-binding protein